MMAITRRTDREGLVTTEVSGPLTVTGLLNSVLELGELTAYSSELWEIMLLDDSVEIGGYFKATLEVAHNAKELIQFKSRGAIAMVASDRDTNRCVRRIADMLRGDAVPVTVFEDEAQARKWLSIHMEHSQFDATTVKSVKPREATRARTNLHC